jgi:hypothetical protein
LGSTDWGFVGALTAISTLAVTIVGGIAGQFHWRLEAHKRENAKTTAEHKADDARVHDGLWEKLDKHEALFRDVATKKDVENLRGNIREDMRLLLGRPGA